MKVRRGVLIKEGALLSLNFFSCLLQILTKMNSSELEHFNDTHFPFNETEEEAIVEHETLTAEFK